MENENFDVKQAIMEIIEYQKHLAEEITEIKTSIMEELINPINDEFNKMQHDNALSDFRCKYAEKLEPLNGKLKALEGDDFDIVEKAFDDFSARKDGMEADVYTDKLVEKVNEQLNKISEAFGVPASEVKEVKIETENGEAKAEVEDGEVVAVEGETNTENIEAEDENTEPEAEPEVKDEVKEESEEETESDADNYKEWEEIYNKTYKK
jgi:hypothetical protein